MSNVRPPRGVSSARLNLEQPLNLEQQRKRAKELLRSHRRGETEALARVGQVLSRSPAVLKLAEAQQVVAREAGFASWARLKLHARQLHQTREELLESLLSAALLGDREAVESALVIAPELPQQSLHAAAALADEQAVAARLQRSPDTLGARAGALGGSALAYVCHARLEREREATGGARARIAKALLAAGADPNECVDTTEAPGGKLSVLWAAARHVASPELVSELLAAGAVLEPPGSTAGPPAPPLVGAALGGSLACLRRLLEAGAPPWQAREALEVAVERGDREPARALLEYGCLPDQAGRWRGRNGGCLHAALALGREVSFLELLIDAGASVHARDRDGRTPLSIAVQLNVSEAADLLRERGASEAEVSDIDRLLGACFARDRARVESLLRNHPGLLGRCSWSDHQNVCRAVRRGDTGALAEVLAAGFDPGVIEDGGETALHLAVQQRDLPAIALLIARGVSPDVPDYDNVTARDIALCETDAELRSALSALLAGAPGALAEDPSPEALSALSPEALSPEALSPEAVELQSGHDEVLSRADVEDFPQLLEARRSDLAAHFERAVDLMSEGNITGLRQLLDRAPSLATARSPRFHRATLLHYLGSNGTERSVAPENAAAIAGLLLARGAAVDASCRMYGGGPYQTTLGLAASTDQKVYPPGVLAQLIDVLVRAGARVHERDGRSRALEGAILHGATIALRALAAHGARAYDLATAAALGDLSVLEANLEGARQTERIAAFENAAAFSQLRVLERLFASGFDLDARGTYGATALHKAAAANAADAVRWLLEQGADPEARDRSHQGTPADWARHFAADEALAVLTTPR